MTHAQDAERTLLLVDGSSYLYRAFHAMPDLRANPQDRNSAPTGALRGMINMLRALEKEIPAAYRVCIFDASGPTFRDAIYPQYKANRSPMPDDLRAQIAPIHQLVQMLGWRVLSVEGVEADDVIGTLSLQGGQQNFSVCISSGDKDLAQLVNERVTLLDTMNGKRRDREGVEKEFGVRPNQMLDYQTLVGDAVDNVPGVNKVGPKTAVKWLTQYGTLDGILNHLDAIGGVVGENLRAARDWLPTGRSLLQIKTDCDLSAVVTDFPQLESLRAQEPQTLLLKDFFLQYGFKGLAQSLDGGASTTDKIRTPKTRTAQSDLFAEAIPEPITPTEALPIYPVHYETILTEAQLFACIERIRAATLVALDTETNSLNAMQAQLIGISVCTELGWAAYIPLGHDYPDAPQQLNRAWVLEQLRPWLEDEHAPKVGAHCKYDSHVFANIGIGVRAWAHDVMLQSYVLEVHRPHGLESLAQRHLGRKGLSYEDLCGKGAQAVALSQIDIARVTQYACEDADFTLAVHQRLYPAIAADEALHAVYQLEIRSSATLMRIERRGVAIDAHLLELQSRDLGLELFRLEQQAYQLANGRNFNLASPKQIGEIFFSAPPEGLGLPIVKKTATGAPSTDEEVLEKLAQEYPLPATILQHRGLSKLKSTYTDKLPLLINQQTRRVHTHYAQAVAVTGRLSSNEPNLQNIPVRTAAGRRVREAFIPRDTSCCIVSFDYSQIELRIMAHLSGDESLIRAFQNGEDVHRATAAEIFGVALAAVDSEQRRYAKVINFGLIYGMSAFGLAKALGISNSDAKEYIERYFTRYPGVRQYMEATRAQAQAQGFVETVMGRRLYLPEIRSPNGPRRAAAERAAINAPMQGTAADLIKIAMNRIDEALAQSSCSIWMMMQVHDELVFDVPYADVDWLRETIIPLMEGAAQFKVPLLVEMGTGKNWDEAH